MDFTAHATWLVDAYADLDGLLDRKVGHNLPHFRHGGPRLAAKDMALLVKMSMSQPHIAVYA